MAEEAFDRMTAAWTDLGGRVDEYLDVWRSAISRNAAEDYKAEHWLEDLQTLWGMSIRDSARVCAAFVDTFSPYLSTDDGGGAAAPA